MEVGKIEVPQANGFYQAGQVTAVSISLGNYIIIIIVCQFFLHQVFGYRGVLLFPWMARVFDRDLYETDEK